MGWRKGEKARDGEKKRERREGERVPEKQNSNRYKHTKDREVVGKGKGLKGGKPRRGRGG